MNSRSTSGLTAMAVATWVALCGLSAAAQDSQRKSDAPPASETNRRTKETATQKDEEPGRLSPQQPRPSRETPREGQPQRRTPPTLGMTLESQGDQGLVVSSVEEESLAARGGLRPRDRIVSIDGRPFVNPRHVQAYLAGQTGRRVPIIIDRDGQRYTVTVTPAAAEGDSAWLGVFLDEGDGKTSGARITHIYPAGPAARAGLDEGDVIVEIAGQPVEGSAELIAVVQGLEPRSQAEFVIVRDDERLKVPVVLGSRSAAYAAQRFRSREEEDDDDERQETSRYRGSDAYENVEPYAMQLEHERRQSEQHERIENEIRLLREEIAKLREELARK